MGQPRLQIALDPRAERNALFWQTLKRYTRRGAFVKPAGVTVVFDIGCGTAEEAMALASFFSSGIAGVPSAKCDLYLIEKEKPLLEAALAILAEPPVGALFAAVPKVHCVAGDATDLTRLTLPEQAQFVLLRHQFIASDHDAQTDVWGKIFESAAAKLAPGGLMLLTSFSKTEHDWAVARLQTIAGLSIVCQEENPHQIPLQDPRPIAGDKFVVLMRKAAPQTRSARG